MNPVTAYFAGLGITVALALGVVAYLSRHLVAILSDICGTASRGAFWTAFSNVALVLVPLIGALHLRPQEG